MPLLKCLFHPPLPPNRIRREGMICPAVRLQRSPSLITQFTTQLMETVGDTIPRSRYLLTCGPKKTPYAFCANASATTCAKKQVSSINKQGRAKKGLSCSYPIAHAVSRIHKVPRGSSDPPSSRAVLVSTSPNNRGGVPHPPVGIRSLRQAHQGGSCPVGPRGEGEGGGGVPPSEFTSVLRRVSVLPCSAGQARRGVVRKYKPNSECVVGATTTTA